MSEPAADQNAYFVRSLARGLAVLAAFTPERPELSLSEIAEVAGVTNPSALRIGYTLVELGFLTRIPATKGYRIGPGVLKLGMASLSSMALPDIAAPFLTQLRDEVGETVKMAVLHDTEMVYVARYPAPGALSTTSFIGSRLPAPQTCTGRAILATLDPQEARGIVERSHLEHFTERSLTTVPEILAELAASRARGYSLNDRGTTVEHRSAAVPLVDAAGHPVGAVNISVSVQRVGLAELESRLVPALRATAARISAVLPPEPRVPAGRRYASAAEGG